MKYLRLVLDMLRMMLAMPLYLAALMCGSFAAGFEWLADKVDILDGPPEPGRG